MDCPELCGQATPLSRVGAPGVPPMFQIRNGSAAVPPPPKPSVAERGWPVDRRSESVGTNAVVDACPVLRDEIECALSRRVEAKAEHNFSQEDAENP
jgi:hypothetical protein